MKLFLGNDPLVVDIGGRHHPVKIRRSAQARKMILRIDAVTGDVRLTAPHHVSARALQRFVTENSEWIACEYGKVAAVPAIETGSSLPFLGQAHQIIFTGVPPRRVEVTDREIRIGGPADQALARLERWFRAQAKILLSADATEFAEKLGVTFDRVSIGDMKSRWGSCSSTGTLRFNWRLILASPAVRRYVAAHEVAHICEMNHSDRFWHHVESVDPAYKSHRKWLKSEGSELMRFRFRSLQTGG